jgi:FkbM family methyltransferase
MNTKFERTAHSLPSHIQLAEAEEKLRVREYFNNKPNGVYIEVGANDPTSPESQTYHLERLLNWTGILIEPIPFFADVARNERPNSIVCQCVCTSPSKTGVTELHVPRVGNELISGHASVERNLDEHEYKDFVPILVDARTLFEICSSHNVIDVDLLSIDVEGAELDVLMGASLSTLRPRLILLEDKHLYLSKHRFLVKSGYVLAQRHNRNSWYVRKDQPLPQVKLRDKVKLWKRMYLSIWVKKVRYSIKHKTIKPFLAL